MRHTLTETENNNRIIKIILLSNKILKEKSNLTKSNISTTAILYKWNMWIKIKLRKWWRKIEYLTENEVIKYEKNVGNHRT